MLAVVNTYVRPVLLVLTLPVTILTLGLFTLGNALSALSNHLALLLLLYLGLALMLALRTGVVLALLAAMPLLLAPPLSALVYWLLWSEFHR